MRLVYALQFRIAAPAGVTGVSLPELLAGDVGTWISGWYKQRRNLEVSLPKASQIITPLPLHTVETAYSSARAADAVHDAVTWKYPAETDDRLLWESRCEWASTGADTEFSFLLRIASREFIVAPPHFDIRRPRIVRSIVQKYRCFSGGHDLSSLPERVQISTLPVLLATLLSRERRLPSYYCQSTPIRNDRSQILSTWPTSSSDSRTSSYLPTSGRHSALPTRSARLSPASMGRCGFTGQVSIVARTRLRIPF